MNLEENILSVCLAALETYLWGKFHLCDLFDADASYDMA